MKRILVSLALATTLGLAVPAIAGADVTLRVNPANPIVDEVVKASFKVNKPLRSGWHYEAMIVGQSGYNCASMSAVKTSKRNPGRGKFMSFSFDSYDGLLGASKWCQGKAHVTILKVPNANPDGGGLIGIKEFRFLGMP